MSFNVDMNYKSKSFAPCFKDFNFKIIYDIKGTEYIVLDESRAEKDISTIEIADKTAFEAVENHIHMMERISFVKLFSLQKEGENLCRSFLLSLKKKYPTRDFVVCVTLTLHDAMILRFHQKWKDEADYYSDTVPYKNTILIKMKSVENGIIVSITNGTVFGIIRRLFTSIRGSIRGRFETTEKVSL